VAGELDLTSAPQLDAVIRGLGGGERRTIIVDLSNLSFMDRSGLRLLLRAAQTWQERGHRFTSSPSRGTSGASSS
jgi:anti-anti-sigma factor